MEPFDVLWIKDVASALLPGMKARLAREGLGFRVLGLGLNNVRK